MNESGLNSSTSILTNCPSPELTFSDPMGYAHFSYFAIVICLPIIGGFGVIGNLLNILVFSRQLRNANVTHYLLSLAVCDIIVSITSFFMFSLERLRHLDNTFMPLYIYTILFTYPIGTMAQTGSVYSTVMAAVDCFVSFCMPKLRRHFCTSKVAKISIFTVVLFSVVYNLPHFFEVELTTCIDPTTNETFRDVGQTPLRSNELYQTIYYLFGYTIVMNVIPLVLLIILNGFIISGVVKQRRLIRASSNGNYANRTNSNTSSSDASALIVVVLLFILCNTVALVINFVEMDPSAEDIMNYLVDISNLLVVINSSANFLIYLWLDGSFRAQLRLLCRSNCCQNRVEMDYLGELDILHNYEIVREISQPRQLCNGTAKKSSLETAACLEENGNYKVVFYQV